MTEAKVPEVRKITQKIIAYKVKKEDEEVAEERFTFAEWEELTKTKIDSELQIPVEVATMHRDIKRPDSLRGTTVKLKPPESGSIYLTMNSQKVDGLLYPREVFFHSKNPVNTEWSNALALTISAVFRIGGNVDFLVDELSSVYSYSSYWSKDKVTGKGKQFKGIVHEVAEYLKVFLADIDRQNAKVIAAKAKSKNDSESKIDFESKSSSNSEFDSKSDSNLEIKQLQEDMLATELQDRGLPNAQKCPSCDAKSAVLLDNCLTCLDCGFSKCG